MMYADVLDGVVQRTRPRPDWYEDDGVPASDELLAQSGILPVIQDPPEHNSSRYALASRDIGEWTVEPTRVTITWDLIERALSDRKAVMLAALAARRLQAEEGGTLLGGMPIATDRTTQTKVTAAYVKADKDPAYTIADWKAPAGWTALTAPQIIAIGNAIEAHVQTCFSHERQVSDVILAAVDHDALDAIDIEAGWPA